MLISDAGSLDDLCQRVEDLTGNADGLEEIVLPCGIHHFLPRVVPVKVHHGLLESQKVVDGADDQVDSRRVTSLTSQVILPI